MPTASDKNSVQSLAKGFRVLEAFTAERIEMGLAEVARAANIDNATAFRFLNTLVQLGYVEKIAEAKRFRLTLKCLDLGFNAIARTDLRELARPLLRELVNDTIEAASIGVPDGADIVYVERVQAGLVRLGVDVRIGSRVPAYSTAVGQAILAHLPRETQVRLLEASPRRKLTPTTLTRLDALLTQLEQIRAQALRSPTRRTSPACACSRRRCSMPTACRWPRSSVAAPPSPCRSRPSMPRAASR